MKDSELIVDIKPCPFCGGEKMKLIRKQFTTSRDLCGVSCPFCIYEVTRLESPETDYKAWSAISVWNTRSPQRNEDE